MPMRAVGGNLWTMRKLLVAIPALNEAPTVGRVISSIPRIMEGLDGIDVLVVDDGSADATAETSRDSGAMVIRHGRNLGLGKAFRTALDFARSNGYHYMVTIDADGQFDPKDIPLLLAPLIRSGADFATASRFLDPELEPKMPALKRWGNRVVARLVSMLSGVTVRDATCGFRAYGPVALEKLSSFSSFTYTQEVIIDLASKGLRIEEVPLKVLAERPVGDSRIAASISRYAVLSLAAMYSTAHDHKPWRFYGIPALILLLLGIACELFVGIRWLLLGMVTPFKGIAISGLFLIVFGALLVLIASLADTSSHNRHLIEQTIAENVRLRRNGQGSDRDRKKTEDDETES
ncbi:glycosyltransferase [Candidatus Fermentibacteria bacterium]|nr:glycosyltransferase [Candidatus Fermentibacteria bacterium]